MPIRPENRDRYPPNWPEISARIRDRDGHRCRWCSVPNGELGGRSSSGTWYAAHALEERLLGLRWPEPGAEWWCGPRLWLRIVRVVLTVAHLDHQPENCSDANLVALCQRCHNLYDGPHRRAGIWQRARADAAIGDLFA